MRFVMGAAVAAAMCLAAPASHAGSLYGELNGAKVGGLTGAELGAGYQWALGAVRVAPIAGALIYQGDNDRYREERVSNGNTACRDTANGRFADKENCDNTALQAYGKLEATLVIADRFQIGGGVRVSKNDALPYGTIAFDVAGPLMIKGFGGKDYYGGGLALAF